jgi:hypothetical protein
MEIITRKQAFALARTRFYTGRPCKNGHDCERYTSTGGCSKCVNGSYKGTWKIARGSKMPDGSPRACGLLVQVPITATAEQRETFAKWVQHQCVPAFFEPLGLRLGVN